MKDQTPSAAEPSPRERILVTAHDLFYRDGIRATGIDRVIAHARVTKVTFYRHYPSKNALIMAYLAYRHENWMKWLKSSLEKHTTSGLAPLDALLSTFGAWWSSSDYRGCAFINTAAELGGADPEVLAVVRQHKAEMTSVLETLLPADSQRPSRAGALAVAIDGAIVHAQTGMPVDLVLATLRRIAEPLLSKEV
ncbi:MAG: TetR/AcrR family transcriptional regulator [Thiomonas sp.]